MHTEQASWWTAVFYRRDAHINMQPLVMFVLTSSQNITFTNNLYVHTVHRASSLYKQAESGYSLEQMIKPLHRQSWLASLALRHGSAHVLMETTSLL